MADFTMTTGSPTTAATLFAGSGELCAQLRSRDWSQTPLGAVDQWPSSLCTLIRTLLHSPAPLHLLWGSQRIPFYNDRWAELLGISPAVPMVDVGLTLGAEWAAEWETWVAQVMTEGVAIQRDRLRMVVPRSGGRMASDFTVCLSPVWDETGAIAGVLGVWSETSDPNPRDRSVDALPDVSAPASEGLFMTLAEATPAAIFRFNADNQCIDVNHRWSEMTGYPRTAALGMGWLETLHPDDRDRLVQAWLAWCTQTDGRSLYQNEGRVLCPDGSVVWFYVQALAEIDDQGTLQGYVGVLTNITALKQTETHLRDTQQQLQQKLAEIEAIYQSAPIGLSVLDTDLRFVRLNQRLAEMNGVAIADHLGRSVQDVLPNLATIAEAVLTHIITTGEPLLNVEITGETPAQPGVQRTWVEHFLPLKTGDRVIGISTVCEEITERKRVEAELQHAKADLELRVAERTEELRRINATLQHSESTLRSFFNSDGSLMAIVELYDDDLWLVSVNQEMADFWNTPVTQLQHCFLSTLNISQEMMRDLLQHYRTAHRLQQPVKFEFCREVHGKICWLSSSICPIAVSPSGQPRFSYIAKDISDRKQIEADLQASETRYRGIVQDQTEMIVRFSLDNIILFTNTAFCRFVGKSLEAIIGTSYIPVVHPDDCDAVLRQIQTLTPDHPICIENRVFNAQGDVRWTQWVNRLLLSPAGQPMEVQSVGRDVTDLKLAEQALRQSEERLQLALEASGDGIWDWNITTNTVYYSPQLAGQILRQSEKRLQLALEASGDGIWDWNVTMNAVYYSPQYFQMLGYQVDDLPHTAATWEALIHPEDRDRVMDILNRHLADPTVPYKFDYRLRTKTGAWKWIASYGKVVARDAAGNPLRMIGTHRDVSDRKYAQERITASLHEKEVLLKEIHHRVKNNLQIVDGLLNMQSRRSTDPQIIAVLRDSQSRITSIALVHEKLYRSDNLANIDFGQYLRDLTMHLFESYNVDPEQIQLKICVHGVHLEIETAIPCGLIVNELISNSLKYAFPGDRHGVITIDLRQIGLDPFTLIVHDDGVGLPPDFDIQHTRSLGMTLVQGLVAQLEGNLAITAQHGTTFTISFPRKLIK